MPINRRIDQVRRNHLALAGRIMVRVRFSKESEGWIQVSKTAMLDVLKYVSDNVEGELDKEMTLWIGE